MREKTALSRSICCTDAFLELTPEAQALYLQLNLYADGLGAVDAPRTICRGAGFDNKTFDELVGAGYLDRVSNENDEVYFIVHFWINNKKDRTHMGATKHEKLLYEKLCFPRDEVRVYLKRDEVDDPSTVDSLDEVFGSTTGSRGVVSNTTKPNINKNKANTETCEAFTPPTVKQLRAYVNEENLAVNVDQFFDYYESIGWKVGSGAPMKDWEAAARSWSRRETGEDYTDLF